MDKLMYDLKDMILCDIDETVKKGQINPADYQALGEAVDIIKDIETIEAMRRLATHPGMCHVRTPDGSSYHADMIRKTTLISISQQRKGRKFCHLLTDRSLE